MFFSVVVLFILLKIIWQVITIYVVSNFLCQFLNRKLSLSRVAYQQGNSGLQMGPGTNKPRNHCLLESGDLFITNVSAICPVHILPVSHHIPPKMSVLDMYLLLDLVVKNEKGIVLCISAYFRRSYKLLQITHWIHTELTLSWPSKACCINAGIWLTWSSFIAECSTEINDWSQAWIKPLGAPHQILRGPSPPTPSLTISLSFLPSQMLIHGYY